MSRRRSSIERGRKTAHRRSAPDPLRPSAPLPSARYLFFGGKGGTGKTTCAAAAALLLLDRAREDERILLFSIDPAHSLSDTLEHEIGGGDSDDSGGVIEVARRGAARLFAREMDAARALDEFKTKHRATLREIADRGTLLDDDDINELLDLSLPGLDEVMALFELSEIDRAGSYARIVVDTAPSGHTSRLLRLPEVFARWIGALDRMAEKHRYMVAHFARRGRARADEVDLFLRDLTDRVERARAVLFNPAQASFTLVTIPEAMSVEESVRYYDLLCREGVPVTDVIVNRVELGNDDCAHCRARARGQARSHRRIAAEFAALQIHHVPLLGEEVRGTESLRRFATLAWETAAPLTAAGAAAAAGGQTGGAAKRLRSSGASSVSSSFRRRPASTAAPARASREAFFARDRRRLIIFGGKGGTGKTTAAAATALALAGHESERRVLVFSSDPAHSLSDSFDERVGELKRGVAKQPNLDAMEIDPAARFETLKERYRVWIDELFESLTGGSRWEIQFDREAMRELVALAPPGVDEIAALSVISDLIEEGEYASIALDTAPTGHLVRFLELPDVALSWVRTFIKLLLKYRDVIRWGGVAEELIALSKNIKRVAALLTDAESCEFIGVAIPEHMSLEETTRLAASLERLKVPFRRLLINNVVAPEAAAACGFCFGRRRAQQAVIAEFRRRFGGGAVSIFVAPQQPHEIQGGRQLREHFARWRLLADE